MSWLENILPGSKPPEVVNVIVETPKGSQNKYQYDKKNNIIKLDRVLYSPFHYPGDYGFIPQTLCGDGDPLDGLVLVTEPTHPGILIECRPIGVMKMIDNGEEDDKILCVPADDPRFSGFKDLKDVAEHVLKEIAHFFSVYKQLQGKKVEVKGWLGVKEAHKVILDSIKMYKSKK